MTAGWRRAGPELVSAAFVGWLQLGFAPSSQRDHREVTDCLATSRNGNLRSRRRYHVWSRLE